MEKNGINCLQNNIKIIQFLSNFRDKLVWVIVVAEQIARLLEESSLFLELTRKEQKTVKIAFLLLPFERNRLKIKKNLYLAFQITFLVPLLFKLLTDKHKMAKE